MGVKSQVFRLADLKEIDRGVLSVSNYFNDENMEALSVSRVVKKEEITSHYTDRDMIDYVIEGEGYCIINGEKKNVSAGDLVLLPRGTHFTWSGGVTLLAISHPRFK